MIRLSVKPDSRIAISAANREIGIELPTIRLARISPKNRNSVSIDRTIPIASVSPTDLSDSMISSAVFAVTSRVTSGSARASSSNALLTWFATVTVLALCFFVTSILIFSDPLWRLMFSASFTA